MPGGSAGGAGGGYNYVQDGQPANPEEGEEWYDTGANAAFVFDGANWVEQTVVDHGQLSGVGETDHRTDASVQSAVDGAAVSSFETTGSYTDPAGVQHTGELAESGDMVSDHSDLSGVTQHQHHPGMWENLETVTGFPHTLSQTYNQFRIVGGIQTDYGNAQDTLRCRINGLTSSIYHRIKKDGSSNTNPYWTPMGKTQGGGSTDYVYIDMLFHDGDDERVGFDSRSVTVSDVSGDVAQAGVIRDSVTSVNSIDFFWAYGNVNDLQNCYIYGR